MASRGRSAAQQRPARFPTAKWEKDVSIPGTEVAKASIPRGAAGGKKVNGLFGGPRRAEK